MSCSAAPYLPTMTTRPRAQSSANTPVESGHRHQLPASAILRDTSLRGESSQSACAAGGITYHHERNLLAIDGCGSAMCGFDNRIKNLGWNCVTLITAAAAMSLQQIGRASCRER